MKKYDVWFCSCGRIQLMPEEYYSWLAEDYENRSVIRICGGCGKAMKVFLTESCYQGHDINSVALEQIILDESNKDNIRIIYDAGIKVPVKNGYYATSHFFHTWSDEYGHSEIDVEQLIKDVNDEDILKSIAAYSSGIDWTGTPYAYGRIKL